MIIINNHDIDSAQVFSLIHEFCHVLLRRTGVCNDFDYYVSDRANEIRRIESFCNQFAANFLVPRDHLVAHRLLAGERFVKVEHLGRVLDSLSKDFKVSKSAILRRLLTFNFIDKTVYKEKIEEWKKLGGGHLKKGGGHNVPARTTIDFNGPTFTGVTLQAYKQRRISYANISEYLGIKTKYIPALESLLRKT